MQRYKVFNVDERGYAHVQQNLPKQDNSCSEVCEDYALAIISDGHGSAQYFRSDRGSAMAVQAASEILKGFITHASNVESPKNQLLLKKKIKERWDQLVMSDYRAHPFTTKELELLEKAGKDTADTRTRQRIEEYLAAYRHGRNVRKAYGCTLIALASFRGYTLGIHIGDGTCVAFYPDGSNDQPIPADPRNMASTTGSLSNDDTGCRIQFFRRTPFAVFAASDGIDDSFGVGEMLYNFYRGICINFAENGDSYRDTLQLDLSAISEHGSKDDMSIAGIYDPQQLLHFEEVLKKQYECGKLRIFLNHLTDTSGGVSDYSLEAAKRNWERAQKEQEKMQLEVVRLKEEQKNIHDRLLSIPIEAGSLGVGLGNPDFVSDKRENYQKRISELRRELDKTNSQLQSIEEERQNTLRALLSFEEKVIQYQRQERQEQSCIEARVRLSQRIKDAEENVRQKEQRYYELRARRKQADEEMKQLTEQIDLQEIEIRNMLHALDQPEEETAADTSESAVPVPESETERKDES